MARGTITVSGTLLTIRTPYNAEWIAQFKALIPRWDRVWDADRRVWTCARRHLDRVLALCSAYFGPIHLPPEMPAVVAPPPIIATEDSDLDDIDDGVVFGERFSELADLAPDLGEADAFGLDAFGQEHWAAAERERVAAVQRDRQREQEAQEAARRAQAPAPTPAKAWTVGDQATEPEDDATARRFAGLELD